MVVLSPQVSEAPLLNGIPAPLEAKTARSRASLLALTVPPQEDSYDKYLLIRISSQLKLV